MSLWIIGQVRKLVTALLSGQTPRQIATGFAIGMVMGLVPFYWGLFLLLFVFLALFNVNMGAGFLAMGLFKVVAPVLDGAAHHLGWLVLTLPALKGPWTLLYNMPIFPLTHFNNTVVMGSLLIGFGLYLPVFFMMRRFVVIYREKWHETVMSWRIVKAIKASKFFGLIAKVAP